MNTETHHVQVLLSVRRRLQGRQWLRVESTANALERQHQNKVNILNDNKNQGWTGTKKSPRTLKPRPAHDKGRGSVYLNLIIWFSSKALSDEQRIRAVLVSPTILTSKCCYSSSCFFSQTTWIARFLRTYGTFLEASIPPCVFVTNQTRLLFLRMCGPLTPVNHVVWNPLLQDTLLLCKTKTAKWNTNNNKCSPNKSPN